MVGDLGVRAYECAAAIVEVFSGKATVDQVTLGSGVDLKTGEKWRGVALKELASLYPRLGKSKQEEELERKLRMLELVLS